MRVFEHFCLVAQDMENISEDDGWEFVNLGDQQSFGIKTAGLEEKATACQMLVSSRVHYSTKSTEAHECPAKLSGSRGGLRQIWQSTRSHCLYLDIEVIASVYSPVNEASCAVVSRCVTPKS